MTSLIRLEETNAGGANCQQQLGHKAALPRLGLGRARLARRHMLILRGPEVCLPAATHYVSMGKSRAPCRAWARSSFRRPWNALRRF